MFKVGDKVRRVKDTFRGMQEGDIDTIESLTRDGNMYLTSYSGIHDLNVFKLVEEPEASTDTLISHNIELEEQIARLDGYIEIGVAQLKSLEDRIAIRRNKYADNLAVIAKRVDPARRLDQSVPCRSS